MGPQVKLPQKLKAPKAFQNTYKWCGFCIDHGHKTKNCILLKMEVNKLLKKRYLQELFSDRVKSLFNKRKDNNNLGRISPAPVQYVVNWCCVLAGCVSSMELQEETGLARLWSKMARRSHGISASMGLLPVGFMYWWEVIRPQWLDHKAIDGFMFWTGYLMKTGWVAVRT